MNKNILNPSKPFFFWGKLIWSITSCLPDESNGLDRYIQNIFFHLKKKKERKKQTESFVNKLLFWKVLHFLLRLYILDKITHLLKLFSIFFSFFMRKTILNVPVMPIENVWKVEALKSKAAIQISQSKFNFLENV